MNAAAAQLVRSRLLELTQLMSSPAQGSDAVLWAAARALEAADLLLQAYLAADSTDTSALSRQALLEAVTNCRAATVAATSAIRAPSGSNRPSAVS